MIQAAIYGYGNIGNGVYRVLEENKERVAAAIGEEINVKYVLDLREFEGDPIHDKVVHDVDTIVNDPEIQIIAETMGGDEPAFTFTKKALMAGKSVCTSNKELVANHGAELLQIAAEHNCCYFFEASVGGGIPCLRTLNSALRQEVVEEITGIVNGTTNYILTRMMNEGAAFADVLADAQANGYAERNPAADVEGYDACRKIAILCSLMSEKSVDYKDVYTEGITKISAEDFLYAKALGRTIKLLVSAQKTETGYSAMVAPALIALDEPLASVNDVFNAVQVRGNMLGVSMYYGRGAGKLPTASAVVADMLEAAECKGKGKRIPWAAEKQQLDDFSATERAFFVRVEKAETTPDCLNNLFGGGEAVSVSELPDEFGFVTPFVTEKEFAEKTADLKGVLSVIRLK